MRLFFFTLALMAWTLSAHTQSLSGYCWDFEQSCSNPANAFFLGCIPNALSACGTPDNQGPGSPNWPAAAPNGGAKYAHMYTQFYSGCPGISGYQGEGMLLQFNFKQGHTYKIDFWATQGPGVLGINELRVILDKSQPNQTGGGMINGCDDTDIIPNVLTHHQDVFFLSGNSVPHMNWTKFSQSVTCMEDFSQIWFRPRQTASPSIIGDVFIDNVCVEEILCPQADFSLSLCKAELNKVRVTVTNPAPVMGTWELFHAVNCSAGAVPGNIGALAALNFLDPAKTQFEVPFNSGCYIVRFTVPADESGCPAKVHLELFNSFYAFKLGATGDYSYEYWGSEGCVAPNYTMRFYPDYIGDATHTWRLFDLSNPATPIQTISQTTGPANLNFIQITLDYGKAYRLEHFVNASLNGYCLVSDVYWYVFGCGHLGGGQEGLPTSGVYSSAEGAIPDYPFQSESGGRSVTKSEYSRANSTLYPNPVTGANFVLQAAVAPGEAYSVRIFDVQGHPVRTYEQLRESDLILDRESLSPGLYIVRLQHADGRQETLKLLVL